MNFIALHHWMLVFVASIPHVEVEISNKIAALRVDRFEALLELLITNAVKSREEVIVL